MAANTQSWWLTDLRLKSCPLLKVYSYASDWPLAIFAWNSSQCLRFSSWACPLPHRSQFPFPVPSSCPAVLVSESSRFKRWNPPPSVSPAYLCSPGAFPPVVLDTSRLQISFFKVSLTSLSFYFLPCVFIIEKFGHLLCLPANSSGCPFPSASLITYQNDVSPPFPYIRPLILPCCLLLILFF